MRATKAYMLESHVVDILGSTRGRDQPIMLVDRALYLASTFSDEIFFDENAYYLDPFCKAGEVLLSLAMRSCVVKKGRKPALASEGEIAQELYSGRYLAVAPDERHYLLSKRTFLGNRRSHMQSEIEMIRNGNYLSEVDGCLNKIKFIKELNSMIDYIKSKNKSAKIIAIGNPPYQEADEGFGGSATAIYNFFAEALMDCPAVSEFALVIPSRWFSAGKGTEDFRARVLKSSEIKSIKHFKQSKEIFPTVDVLGGVCFLHFQRNFKGKTKFIEGDIVSEIELDRYDIIPDDAKAYPIIEKVKSAWTGKFVSELAWSRKPFGIDTTYFKRKGEASKNSADAIKCYAKGRKVKFAKRSDITKNEDKIDLYKVAVPRAYAPGSKLGVRRVTLPLDQYFVIPKGEITAETYNVVAAFVTKKEADNFQRYLQTDFARYLLGLRKITQDIPKDRWDWVPVMDASEVWTDERLFSHFKLSKVEQAHIRKKVQEWS